MTPSLLLLMTSFAKFTHFDHALSLYAPTNSHAINRLFGHSRVALQRAENFSNAYHKIPWLHISQNDIFQKFETSIRNGNF